MASSKPWYHPPMSKEESVALISQGGLSDGKFLVRARGEGNDNEHVLVVVYKGKPTHHLVAPGDDGNLTVNKKNYGDGYSHIDDLIEALSSGVKGWPVQLQEHVASSGGSDGGSSVGSDWLHPASVTREASEELVSGKPDGTFLVRKRPGKDTEFVLTVVYKGKATQHLIKKDGGVFGVNNKDYGLNSKSLNDLISGLAKTGVKGWPVPLTNPISSGGSDSGDSDAAAAEAKAAEEKRKAEEAKKKAAAKAAEEKKKAAEEAKKAEEEAKKAEEEAKKAEEAKRAEEEAKAAEEAEKAKQAEAEEKAKEKEAERKAAEETKQAEEEKKKQEEEKANVSVVTAPAPVAIQVSAVEPTSPLATIVPGGGGPLEVTNSSYARMTPSSSTISDVGLAPGQQPQHTASQQSLIDITAAAREASARLEERRKLAMELQKQQLELQQQYAAYTNMVSNLPQSPTGYGPVPVSPIQAQVQQVPQSPTATQVQVPQSSTAPQPLSSPVSRMASNMSSVSSASKKKSTKRKGRAPKQAWKAANDEWDNKRKEAYRKIKGKIQTKNPSDAPTESQSKVIDEAGMYITQSGFVERDGSWVHRDITV